jgi:hypothetical protein
VWACRWAFVIGTTRLSRNSSADVLCHHSWTEPVPAPPAELRTVAGIRRDPELERKAYEMAPLREFFGAHFDEIAPLAPVLTMIAPVLAVAPRLTAATPRLLNRQDIEPTTTPRNVDPRRLTDELKAYAADRDQRHRYHRLR